MKQPQACFSSGCCDVIAGTVAWECAILCEKGVALPGYIWVMKSVLAMKVAPVAAVLSLAIHLRAHT